MPTYKYGNMWSEYDKADLFLFTGNGTLKGDELIMGKGSAGQVVHRLGAGVKRILGTAVLSAVGEDRDHRGYTISNHYHVLTSPDWPKDVSKKLGAFQTKDFYGENSDLALIAASCIALTNKIQAFRDMYERDPIVHMPYPGIGAGRLAESDVEPIIENLPDCVHIWQFHKPTEYDYPAACKNEWWYPLVPNGREPEKMVHVLEREIGQDAMGLFKQLYKEVGNSWYQRIQQAWAVWHYKHLLDSGMPEHEAKQGAYGYAKTEFDRLLDV